MAFRYVPLKARKSKRKDTNHEMIIVLIHS
jgi:hypothetical protein